MMLYSKSPKATFRSQDLENLPHLKYDDDGHVFHEPARIISHL